MTPACRNEKHKLCHGLDGKKLDCDCPCHNLVSEDVERPVWSELREAAVKRTAARLAEETFSRFGKK